MSAFEKTKRKCLLWDECMRLSLLFKNKKQQRYRCCFHNSERGIRTLDTAGMNRML